MTKWHNLGANFHYQEKIMSEHRRKFQPDILVPGIGTWCLQRIRIVKLVQFSNKTAGSLHSWRCVFQQTLCSLKIRFYHLLPQHINH